MLPLREPVWQGDVRGKHLPESATEPSSKSLPQRAAKIVFPARRPATPVHENEWEGQTFLFTNYTFA